MSEATPYQRRQSRRLSQYLTLAFIVLAVLPVGVLTLLSINNVVKRERERVFEHLEAVADAQTQTLERWIDDSRDRLIDNLEDPVMAGAITTLSSTTEAGSAAAAYADARGLFAEHAHTVTEGNPFDQLYLTGLDGLVRGSSLPQLLNRDLSGEPWFQIAREATPGELTFFGPVTDPFDGQESLYFVLTVQAEGSAGSSGLLVGRMGLDALRTMMATGPYLGETEEFFLVRSGRQYVTPPHFSTGESLAGGEIVGTALSGIDGSGTWTDYRGVQVLGVYRWIEPLSMALVGKQDVQEALATARPIMLGNAVIGALVAFITLLVGLLSARRVSRLFREMVTAVEQVKESDYQFQIPRTPFAETNQLAESFNGLIAQLRAMTDRQEEVLRSRTRQLEITARLGQVIARETDLETLLNTTVEMIRDQLGHYHAQVFLLDDLHRNAVLRASTGTAGQELLRRGHRLAVGSESVIGQVATLGEPVLASDTEHAEFWLPNPLLPRTRAELAVPLRLGDRIIGALDVQSVDPNVFDEVTIAALQTVADQLAVAIRNAQLLEEKEGLLSASVQLTQTLTRDGWERYAEVIDDPGRPIGYRYDLSEISTLSPKSSPAAQGSGLNLPIALRGAVIGQLQAELPGDGALSEDDRKLVGEVLDRVALALENARLFEQTQHSLAETNRLYDASQRIAVANTLEELSDALIDVSAFEKVDRTIVLVADSIPEDPTRIQLEVKGTRFKDVNDPLYDLPSAFLAGEHPLGYGLEHLQVGDVVLNDVENADIDEMYKAALLRMGVKSLALFAISPMLAGATTLGWLVLHSVTDIHAFKESDIRFLQTAIYQASTALEGIRLVELTQARARRLQAANEVTRTSTSILDTDILLPMIVRQIGEAFGYYHTQIFLIDPAGEWAMLRASTGEVGQELLRLGHKLMVGSHSVIGQVTSRGEPVIALDTDTDPIHHRNELLPDTRAEMAIPLKTGERIIGALDVQSTSPNAFDPEAQAILQSLADQVAVTLENAQLFQEIQDRVAELSTVNLVSQAVSRTDTLESLYEVVTRELLRTFGVQHAVMGVLDDRQRLDLPIDIQGGQRVSGSAQPLIDERLMRRVMDSQEILLLNEDVRAKVEATGSEVFGDGPKSLLIAPLMLADDAIGVVCMLDMNREQAFSDADVRQIGTLSAYIAVKIRNAELLDETQQRADELGFLFDMTRAAVASADLSEALQGVAEVVSHEIEDAESIVIYLANPEAGYLEPEAAVGYGRELIARRKRINWGDGPVGEVATRRHSRVIDDIETESYELDAEDRLRSAVLVPLQAGRQFSGVLTVESTQPYMFGERELRLLETASGTLNAVIQNARLLEQITQAHEQLRELDQLKSQFLANMSHELRTPLNSIIGFSRVMLKGIDGPLNDLQSQDLETIHESGQHLLGLINNILDMSKIEAGKMELQMEYTDLEEIVDAAVTTGHGLVQDKSIELVKIVDPGLPQVYCDPIRIRQILLNLVSNAAKFTEEGTITVRATRVASDPANSIPAHVQIDVIDTGIGIADEDREKIFEAFRQVDGSPTRQAGGTGLGLAISKEFVDMHQGWMWVESKAGVGSTFCFSLPIHPAGQGDPDLIVMPEYDDERPIVLAVDDEPGVIDLYRRYLEKEGYGIVGLRSANDLLYHIRQIQPFVVLLDLHLPGRDGWDAWGDIKRAEDTRHLPVIVCSIDDDRQQGLSRGVAGYLVKPIIEDDLLEAVQRVQRTAANGSKPAFKMENLLVIASPEVAQSVREALGESLDCAIQTAATGRDGLQAALDQQPDLILMDTDLPDMDGYGLLVAMRSQAETSHFPVILLTTETLSADQLASVDPERTRFLNKHMYPGSQLVDGLLSELDNLKHPT